MSHAPLVSAADTYPSDIHPRSVWCQIFSFLPARDLFPVMCTSSAFRALTRPFDPYYRHWNLRAAEVRFKPLHIIFCSELDR